MLYKNFLYVTLTLFFINSSLYGMENMEDNTTSSEIPGKADNPTVEQALQNMMNVLNTQNNYIIKQLETIKSLTANLYRLENRLNNLENQIDRGIHQTVKKQVNNQFAETTKAILSLQENFNWHINQPSHLSK